MKTILVVEDDSAITVLIKGVLEDDGYHVLTAADGRQGLAQVRAHNPDLVITDLMMPVLNGLDLARAVRLDARSRQLPLIAISGAMQPDAVTRQLFTTFLTKPFRLTDLLAAVKRSIGAAVYVG